MDNDSHYVTILHFQILKLAEDGSNIRVFLDKKNGIHCPTLVRSDTKGEQLIVINGNGEEIRNYGI